LPDLGTRARDRRHHSRGPTKPTPPLKECAPRPLLQAAAGQRRAGSSAWKRYGTVGHIGSLTKVLLVMVRLSLIYLNNKETTIKLIAIALACAFALSSTCAFAHPVRHKSNVKTRPMYSDAAPSVVSDPKYGMSIGVQI
jgi:hypothetical protein